MYIISDDTVVTNAMTIQSVNCRLESYVVKCLQLREESNNLLLLHLEKSNEIDSCLTEFKPVTSGNTSLVLYQLK